MKTFDQSEYDTRIWYHGTVAPKACLQAPLLFPPNPLLGSLCSPIFSLFDSNFCLFPLCGAWSQASFYQVVSSMPVTSDLQLGLYKDLGLELGPHSWVTIHSLLPSFVYHCAACWWLLAPYLWCCRRNTEGAFSMIAPQDINCLHCYIYIFCFAGWCWISQSYYWRHSSQHATCMSWRLFKEYQPL